MTPTERFDRLIHEVERARVAYKCGDMVQCRVLLNLVSSIALSKLEDEYGPSDPRPEGVP